ncbi:hypothetical protein ACIBTP_39260 [Streptomyces avidinii]
MPRPWRRLEEQVSGSARDAVADAVADAVQQIATGSAEQSAT